MRTPQLGIAILRLVVGIVFAAHGAQKLFVIGLPGVTHMFQGLGIPMPHVAAIVVTLVELLGGIALILGLFARYAAILLAFDMAVAVVKVHLHNGFFSSKGGYEFPLTLLAACIALAFTGPGTASLAKFAKSGRR